MFRLKMAMKAALVPSIIGLVGIVAGVIMLVVGFVASVSGLLWAGIAVAILGIFCFVIAFWEGKQRLQAICPECQKYMGDTTDGVDYSFVCNQYKENYNSSTHEFRDYTFYYTCSIVCPHCGNTAMFEHKVNAKTEPKANKSMNDYIKGLLKIKQGK